MPESEPAIARARTPDRVGNGHSGVYGAPPEPPKQKSNYFEISARIYFAAGWEIANAVACRPGASVGNVAWMSATCPACLEASSQSPRTRSSAALARGAQKGAAAWPASDPGMPSSSARE
jgi:hypothetical protein